MAPSAPSLSLDNYNLQFENVMRQSTLDPMTGAPLSDDKSTNAPSILAINGALCGVTLLVVLARFYVRSVMLKSVGADDWFMGLAMACGVGTFVCFIGETHHGIGMNSDAIPFAETIKQLHWNFFHSIIVTVGISFIKLSIAFFLLRLVPSKKYKMFLYCTIAFLAAFLLTSAFTIIFACLPVRANWDLVLAKTAKCYSKDTFTAIGLFNSSINIITDVLFATLPIPMVWNLQVNMRTKLSLVVILSLGLFACAAAIVKTVLQSKLYVTPNTTRNDTYFIWNSVELYIGILAASLPSLRPLFKSFLDSTKALRTKMSSSGNQKIGTRHKYYMQEDAIAMSNMGSSNGKNRKYDVKVTTKDMDKDDFGTKSTQDGGSSYESVEGILPMQGIQKTVNISVTR
ncbi:hypothetical protein GLAREA_11778 [Glarea lozoyensis ATCC 20868]|uniref:Rhodopsin domain-containing protein n=2 Tax=Glarea lozoyensis TaxID=101852 RepID=S3CFC3_GLAL2|nr:uncharacterized protein GLAREA_11778 [Glarea lozoyensis ATCC 20868]EPE25197.1 hypothetical protein GLAREA_11778 [Glarea lozoyensis ATCC 20868]